MNPEPPVSTIALPTTIAALLTYHLDPYDSDIRSVVTTDYYGNCELLLNPTYIYNPIAAIDFELAHQE